MSVQIVPNSGPFNDDRLDKLRVGALMALDAADLRLPGEVIAYVMAIERAYVDEVRTRKDDFFRTSWKQFEAKAEDSE